MKKLTMLVLSVFLFSSVVSASAPIRAIITKIRGDAFVKLNDNAEWQKCYVSMVLDDNAAIKTDGYFAGVTVTLSDNSKINLKGNSQIRLNNISQSDRVVEQQKGKSVFKITKLWGGRKFQCKTPVAVCSVRGTEFGVDVNEDNSSTFKVYSGMVDVNGQNSNVTLNPNEKVDVKENVPMGAPTPFSVSESKEKSDIVKASIAMNTGVEIAADMTKEAIQKAAADELRLAEYQQGKTIVDAFGMRVRIQEYIVRTQVDQFKLVVLNERDNRYDYFTNIQTYNTALPTDLSAATKSWRDWDAGSKTTTPTYFLLSNESAASNLKDIVAWGFTGGHITPTNDHFYNNYYFKVNNDPRISYQSATTGANILSAADFLWTVKGYGNMSNTDFMDGTGAWIGYNNLWSQPGDMHLRANIDFGAGVTYQEDYYKINDMGKTSTSADVAKGVYNEEMVLSGSDFTGTDKKIDICVEPQIFKDAGLIK
jgi:hypothetical protein